MANEVETKQAIVTKVVGDDAAFPLLDVRVVQEEIEKALHRVEQIDAKRIKIEINNGRVLLRGEVKTWREHQAAAKATAGVTGVTEVDNQLRVVPWLF